MTTERSTSVDPRCDPIDISPEQIAKEQEWQEEHDWYSQFLAPTLPDTPAALLDECRRVRRVLIAEDMNFAHRTVSRSPDIVRRYWDAMRLMSDVVPDAPHLTACTAGQALGEWLTGNTVQLDALKRVIDDVVRWCVANGAIVRDHAAPPVQTPALAARPAEAIGAVGGDKGGTGEAEGGTPPNDGKASGIPPALLAASDIAKRIKRNVKSVSSFLTRFAAKNQNCRTETETPKPNEPQYLYRTADVWPALEKWMKDNPPK